MATPVRILWLTATLLALPARVPAHSLISLELPGIQGEAGPPAPAGAIALHSFAFGAGTFTAIKAVDASSPELLRAAAEGTLFATARVEVFDTEVVPTQPIEIYLFGDVLITAFLSLPSAGSPIQYEQLTLAFSTVVPEAAGCLLVLTGGLVLVAAGRQRRASA
jgi:type VI protein secretion system component Hcp